MSVSDLKSSLVNQLDDLLQSNYKTKADKLLYQKLVADVIYSWASKKRKELMDHQLEYVIDKPKLVQLIADAIKLRMKATGVILKGKYFRLTANIRSPATRFDKDALSIVLVRDYKLTSEQVQAVIDACSEMQDPAKDFQVEDA
jgi:hypothetical protein